MLTRRPPQVVYDPDDPAPGVNVNQLLGMFNTITATKQVVYGHDGGR